MLHTNEHKWNGYVLLALYQKLEAIFAIWDKTWHRIMFSNYNQMNSNQKGDNEWKISAIASDICDSRGLISADIVTD